MSVLWKQFRYRLEYLGCRAIEISIPALPRRALLWMARRLGRAHWRLDRRGRSVTLANLEAAFGDDLTPAARERIGRASFENFARALLDLFWAPRLDARNHARWIQVANVEEVRAIREKHGAVLFILVHFGSYEWASLAGGFLGFPVWIVAEDFKNPRLDAIFNRNRESSGHHLIGRAQSMLRMFKAIRRGDGGAGLLIDLTLRPEMPSAAITAFGGLRMCVTVLHAVLHERTGVPLTPVTNIPQPDGTCQVTVHPSLTFPPGATHAEIAQGCWDFFEPHIRAHPEQWLWNYKHFRYLPASPGKAYPFYAQRSAVFDTLAAKDS